MKIKNLPKSEPAIEPVFLRNLGIKSYDADNLYPQNVRNIVMNSKTGRGCLERYIDYIEGKGIMSEALAGVQVNLDGQSLADLHSLVSADLGELNGFAVHVNYDIDANITSLHHTPFENVRLCEPDDEGFIRQVALHPDWTGKLTRGGRQVHVRKENIDYIDVFNPDPAVVQKQILEAGGPQYYKGQIFYYSREGYMVYPYAKFHAVLADMSTDEGLSNIMNRNVRNNFLPAGAFVRLKSQGAPIAGDDSDYTDAVEPEEYAEDLMLLQGDSNALKILDITVESKEELPEFVNIQGNNYDKEFTVTAAEVKDDIYAAFNQEGWLAIRNGKVGFSGNLIADVERDYARRQIKIQQALTRCYVRLLSHWAAELPEEPTIDGLTIVPLVDTSSTPKTA